MPGRAPIGTSGVRSRRPRAHAAVSGRRERVLSGLATGCKPVRAHRTYPRRKTPKAREALRIIRRPSGNACHIESEGVRTSNRNVGCREPKCSEHVASQCSRRCRCRECVRTPAQSTTGSDRSPPAMSSTPIQRSCANSTTSPSGTQMALSAKSRPPNPWKPMTTHPQAIASAGGSGSPSRSLKLRNIARDVVDARPPALRSSCQSQQSTSHPTRPCSAAGTRHRWTPELDGEACTRSGASSEPRRMC